MAKQNDPKATTTAPIRSNEVPDDLKAEGFTVANPEELFWKCADPEAQIKLGQDLPPGSANVLRGIVLGREKRKPDPEDDGRQGDQFFYHVVLTAPAILYGRRGADGSSPAHNCAAGFMAWVDERWDLQRMVHMLPKRDATGKIVSVTEAILTPLRKVPAPKGSRWEIRLMAREVPASRVEVPLLEMPQVGAKGDELPPADNSKAIPSKGGGAAIDTEGHAV